MRFAKPKVLIALAVIAAGMLIWAVYLTAQKRAADDVHATAERQLRMIAVDLESLLERYETLPFTLSFHPDVIKALQHPDSSPTLSALNATLEAIQRQAKVSAIYLMDREGHTLAASNWNQPLTFIGRNFAFRPYFQNAFAGDSGHFYGIGNATSEPGYFIAQPVYAAPAVRSGTPIGVIAVKISLAEFEQTWRSSEDPIALADRSGVVFLSNREAWRYHSIEPLNDAAQLALADTKQYAEKSIAAISSLPKAASADFGPYVGKHVGRLQWQLMLFPSMARIQRAAIYAALSAALVIGLAAISLLAMHQRRRRIEERLESRRALQQAAEELERRIGQRTAELLEANRHLEDKYAKLQETEQLLRSTQDELVQAGKLAMLGQMAAGITHELNQPLAAIRTFADNAVTFLTRGQPDKAQDNLGHISAASARMGSIIGQLKGFARKSQNKVARVDLGRAIEASIMLLETEFRRLDASLETDIAEGVAVSGDMVRTEQVLINLLRNALDAVDALDEAGQRHISVSLRREGDEAVVRIRDSGHGIAADAVAHLFEPFFTTKPSGKGLGLGLAISSSIVQAMNGQLSAHNRSEGGAEFILRLPLQSSTSRQDGSQLVSA